ncbi:MAG: hypothetical protein E7589_01000 [Ruminococcaceae bacterium]|nr:hypothetical protein [Oscillospiraceae bacterium]
MKMSNITAVEQKYPPLKVSIVRIIIISVLLFLLISVELGVYLTAISDLQDNLMKDYELTKDKGWQKSLAWMLDEFAMLLPLITVCVFQYAVYKRYNREDGILQREMAFEVILVGVLVYAVLLPVVAKISSDMNTAAHIAGTVERYEDGGVITLLRRSLGWFIRFIFPVGILSIYHFSRSKAEAEDTE